MARNFKIGNFRLVELASGELVRIRREHIVHMTQKGNDKTNIFLSDGTRYVVNGFIDDVATELK